MDRRGFLLGLGASLIAAPSIVRAASLLTPKPVLVSCGQSNCFRIAIRAADRMIADGAYDRVIIIAPRADGIHLNARGAAAYRARVARLLNEATVAHVAG